MNCSIHNTPKIYSNKFSSTYSIDYLIIIIFHNTISLKISVPDNKKHIDLSNTVSVWFLILNDFNILPITKSYICQLFACHGE